jgi:hypothetical protein
MLIACGVRVLVPSISMMHSHIGRFGGVGVRDCSHC